MKKMNVKELIDRLKEFPSDCKVIHRKGQYYIEIKKVELTKKEPQKVRIE